METQSKEYQLMNDRDVSRITAMSQSWVRRQRMMRRQGLEHVFDIDPVMLGSSPRYRQSDVDSWLSRLGGNQ